MAQARREMNGDGGDEARLVAADGSARSATLQDVARAAGVSAMTVSNVLNGKRLQSPHREAIERAVRELNFKLNPHAQRLVNGHCSDTVGLFSASLDLGVGAKRFR